MLKIQFIKTKFENYIYRKDQLYRKFSTKQEKTCTIMHEIEYKEYCLKVRSKRKTRMIDSRDAQKSSLYNAKDWKRSSRRKNQYCKKEEQLLLKLLSHKW